MKKIIKKIVSAACALTLFVSAFSSDYNKFLSTEIIYAATFDDINQSSVFLKQRESNTCTLCAATMMLRRTAMMRGDSDWATITESALKPTAWLNGAGLYNSFKYRDISVEGTPATVTEQKLINLLEDHPEGIVIFSKTLGHAVLLTDYTNGVFYAADPANGTVAGRIPLSDCYKVRVNNITGYWYVVSPDVYVEPVDCPTYFNIKTNKSDYEAGESVVFTFDSDNAVKYNIGVHKDGVPFDSWDTTNKKFEYKLNEPGSYYVYGSAYNSKGSVENSKPVYFEVSDCKAAPTYFNILTDKPKYEVGESVVFTYDSDNATKYNIGMHKDGIPLDTWDTADNRFEYKLNEPGSYYVYGSAFNSKGSVENSKPVYFEVVNCEKEPSYFNISTDKNKYMVGEEMQITFESDTAVKYGVGVHLNGEPYDYIDSFNNEEKITLSKAGTYYFYGSAFNSKGYADNSSPVWVNVYDSAPEISKISIDDSELCVGDTITFKVESDTATAYSLGIYKDGERYDSIWDFTEETHEYLLKESGEYSVYVTSYNSLGYKDSEKVKFTVKEKINKGDCNNDGKLSAIDAIALRKYLLGVKDADLVNSEAADLDDNGVINIVDFIMLKSLLVSP